MHTSDPRLHSCYLLLILAKTHPKTDMSGTGWRQLSKLEISRRLGEQVFAGAAGDLEGLDRDISCLRLTKQVLLERSAQSACASKAFNNASGTPRTVPNDEAMGGGCRATFQLL